MELAIQVAVRIAPAAIFMTADAKDANVKRTSGNSKPNNNNNNNNNKNSSSNSNSNNNNNNNNEVVDEEEEEEVEEEEEEDETAANPVDKQEDGKDDADDNTDARHTAGACCVRAISTPCFIGLAPGVPAALPTQLDNGSIATGLVQVGPHSFPVSHALPAQCTQNQMYHQTVFPLISLLLEGFDASVVTYGQRGTGKTYTLYGPGFDCVYGEADQGIVQRCVREIFAHMANHPERTYAVNIGWVEIFGEGVHDLLGAGNVLCETITEVFHWLQVGLSRRAAQSAQRNSESHTLFTLTLEQHWISKESLIQHRLSTASFSDLCATERLFLLNAHDQPTSMPKDMGLHALEQIVGQLTDPAALYGSNGNISYNRTTLTTLLKDSFGGRAQTLFILCVSPFERDINETICNLQFAFKVQCVRNFVIMNIFSDDSTPISPEIGRADIPRGVGNIAANDNFGLQFAASQWFKLVSNAEGLLSKLVSSNAISDVDKEQIEEWLFLKQECEECLSSSEALRSQKQLNPIQETEEPEETVSEPETSCQQNSDNESDSESQRPDLVEKLENLMEELRSKTDTLVKDKYKEFMQNQPKAVMESQENHRQSEDKLDEQEFLERQLAEKLDERKVSVGGRRRSIQPGASLSSAEIAMLNRVASEQKAPKLPDDLLESSGDLQHATQMRVAINSPQETIQKKLRKLDTDIEARQRQMKEVEQTMQLKQNIITELVKNSETRSTAKQRFHKKKSKLEAEYEKTKKQLSKALVQGKEKCEVERLRAVIAHIEQRLQDLTSMKHIAGESGQKVKKLQQSLHESKKIVDELQKKVKKEKKLRDQLDGELKALKEKENGQGRALVKVELGVGGGSSGASSSGGMGGGAGGTGGGVEEERGKNLKEVQARISHLDHVLREKSENLEQFGEGEAAVEQREGLRHEIRNLRRTRDHLLDQRCSLDRKLKRDKMLSHREERKLLECDEAIEAIDAAIEFKNELICGHKSIDTSERLQREKGEQMLMARLNKLSAEEMRTLLYKYFTKVIDLRDSSRKLEVQLMQLERERDAWEWKERVLSNAVRQARLEGERNVVLLQRQHEMKLTLMLRHLAEETSASSASFGDVQAQQQQQHQQQHRYVRHASGLALAAAPATGTASSYSDSDFDLDFYKNTLKAPKHGDMEICPLPDALTKYKPLDKFKEKERETKNKLFAKFQVLTRYAGQSISLTQQTQSAAADHHHEHGHTSSAGAANKKKDKESAGVVAAIPQENLKRLIAATPTTKVTRQKNKIIIQDATRK